MSRMAVTMCYSTIQTCQYLPPRIAQKQTYQSVVDFQLGISRRSPCVEHHCVALLTGGARRPLECLPPSRLIFVVRMVLLVLSSQLLSLFDKWPLVCIAKKSEETEMVGRHQSLISNVHLFCCQARRSKLKGKSEHFQTEARKRTGFIGFKIADICWKSAAPAARRTDFVCSGRSRVEIPSLIKIVL